MTEMVKKKMINDRLEKLEVLFGEKYEQPFHVNNQKCFKVDDNEFFIVTGLASFNAIVIEHAPSESEARKNMFEDGDLFYMDDLYEEQMFHGMLKEIENQ